MTECHTGRFHKLTGGSYDTKITKSILDGEHLHESPITFLFVYLDVDFLFFLLSLSLPPFHFFLFIQNFSFVSFSLTFDSDFTKKSRYP